MTEATTCPDCCRYLGEGRLCGVSCGHGAPVCPYDDHAMVRAMAALGEVKISSMGNKEYLSHYKRSKHAQG